MQDEHLSLLHLLLHIAAWDISGLAVLQWMMRKGGMRKEEVVE